MPQNLRSLNTFKVLTHLVYFILLCLSHKYLTQINKTKTNALNQLISCLLSFYKFQLKYFEESSKHLNEFIQSMSTNELTADTAKQQQQQPLPDASNQIKCSDLLDFNMKQMNEKEVLEEKLRLFKFRKGNINRAESTPFLNETCPSYTHDTNFATLPNNSTNLNFSSQMNSSITNLKFKNSSSSSSIKFNQNFGGSQPFLPSLSLFEQKRLRVIENLKEFKTNFQHNHHHSHKAKSSDKSHHEKQILGELNTNIILNPSKAEERNGYLMKRALHTRMGKNWLKRKCVAENGTFSIHHYDVIILIRKNKCILIEKNKFSFSRKTRSL